MSNKLIRHSIQYAKEASLITESKLPAGTTELDVPADLIIPVSIEMSDDRENWYPIHEGSTVDPPGEDVVGLRWVWREGRILLSSPLATAQWAYLRYRRSLMQIEDENTVLEVPHSDLYLGEMTAYYVCRFIMKDEYSAQHAMAEARDSWNDILAIEVNASQNRPIRRPVRGYSSSGGGFLGGNLRLRQSSFRR